MLASVGWRNVWRIWGVNGAPGGNIELIAGPSSWVLEDAHDGSLVGEKLGAASTRAKIARNKDLTPAILACIEERCEIIKGKIINGRGNIDLLCNEGIYLYWSMVEYG